MPALLFSQPMREHIAIGEHRGSGSLLGGALISEDKFEALKFDDGRHLSPAWNSNL